MTKLYSISEVSKLLKLVHPVTKKPTNYVLRFWEKKFKQIKPILINKRRYYTKKNIEKFKLIKFLLKDRGLTINGAKRVLENKDTLKLDETQNKTINSNKIKNRLIKISNIIKSFKNQILMAKKTHIKVRLVPESKPDSSFFYYVKKPAGGEKAKIKLKVKKYNPATRKHELFIEKKLPPHSK